MRLFTATAYSSDIKRQKDDYIPRSFIWALRGFGYSAQNDALCGELLRYPRDGNFKTSNRAMEQRSHIVFDNANLKFGTPSVEFSESERATNRANYYACDEEVIEFLSQYDIEGDPHTVLKNDKTVIISASQWNFETLKFKPGDKIKVAKFVSGAPIPLQLTGHELLEFQLQLWQFDYVEYTVGAVLHNVPSFYDIDIFFSNDNYAELTGNEVNYRSIGLYVDPGLSPGEVKALEAELDRWGDYYYAGVTNTYALTERNLTLAKRVSVFITCIAVFLLALTPLLWFFSQVLFAFKRESEFTVLLAIGGVMDGIRRQCVYDGVLSVVFGGVVLAALTFAAGFLTYFATNHFLVQFFIKLPLRYEFAMPWLAFAVGVALALVCAFLSCYIPYLLFKRRVQLTSVTEPEDI